jgi:hypothetical protein
MTELVAYRPLTRDDFRSPVAAGFSTIEERQIGATTCATIIARPDDVVTRSEGTTRYVATLDDPIFFAVFSRKCSWWNPEQTHAESDVLEHEQIHFAVSELEARRLNGRAEHIAERVRTAGSDPRAVHFRAASELHAVLTAASEAVNGRNELFHSQIYSADAVTRRVTQRRWFQKVTAELEATEVLARGPQTSVRLAADGESRVPPPAPIATAAPSPTASHAPPPAAPPPVPTVIAPTAPATNPEVTSTGSFPD